MEQLPKYDWTGGKCTFCQKGIYRETCLTDDWDGTLHCTNCDYKVQRWNLVPVLKRKDDD